MSRILSLFLLCCAFPSRAQTSDPSVLKGRIFQSDSSGLAQATLRLAVRGTVTTTNADGYFAIAIDAGLDTLIVTHIGFEPLRYPLQGIRTESPVQLTLISSTDIMEAVMVYTGYEQLPKERSTGSFTQIDNRRFNEQVGTGVLERLQHISNGVTAVNSRLGGEASGRLLIRGFSTMTAAIQKPLVILDNFEYQGNLDNINPNDVEDITFLKDAAAGSIWGAKAANGVVVITTKKGQYRQPTTLELQTNLMLSEKTDLYDLPITSPGDAVGLERFLFEQGYGFSDTANVMRPAFTPVYETLFAARSGLITKEEADRRLAGFAAHDMRDDFHRHLYRRAVNRQFALNIRGGSEDMAWLVSAGLDQNTSEQDALYRRVNVRLDHSYKPLKNLDWNTSVYFTSSLSESGRPGWGQLSSRSTPIPLYTRLADEEGIPLPLYSFYRQGFIDTLGGGLLEDWRYYPLEDYRYTRSHTTVQDINAVTGFTYRLPFHLTADLKGRIQRQTTETEQLLEEESYYTRDLVNSFAQIDRGNQAVTYPVPQGDILEKNLRTVTAYNLRGQIRFQLEWGRNALNVLAGGEISDLRAEQNVGRTYGYDPSVLSRMMVDYANYYPQQISRFSSNIPDGVILEGSTQRFVSTFGNASYSLDGKYTVSASFRRDASNNFGVAVNDRWKPLWSTGLSWNVSKEEFYRLDWLPALKLRGTYGHQGNVDPSKVAVTTLMYLFPNPLTGVTYSLPDNYANPQLRWEQTAMLNLGIDFSLKNRRISGSIEFYHKNITDLYGGAEMDLTAGIGSTVTRNIASVRGQGWDVMIRSVNLTGPLRWESDLIFNTYQDRVTESSPLPETGRSIVGINNSPFKGLVPYGQYAYRFEGLDPDTGDPIGILDGLPSKNWASITGSGTTPDDLVFVGRRQPPIFGSLGNTLSWKGFSITARLTYKFGYWFLRQGMDYGDFVNSLEGHSDYYLRWQEKGDELRTNVPSFIYPVNNSRDNFYRFSTALATRGDHIRFQYLNVGYTPEWRGKPKGPSIRVFMVLNNPGLLWRANPYGIDPDYERLPALRSYAFGCHLHF